MKPGSPPRVRGILAMQHDDEQLKRITPACAGNTQTSAGGGPQLWDHPRVCGEYI